MIKRDWIYIGIGVVCLLLFTCNNKRLQGQYDVLKKEYNNSKKEILNAENKRLKEKDSLIKLITFRESRVKELKQDNSKLENKIKQVKSKPIIIPKSLQELATYYNNTYKTLENKVVDNKVGLGINTAMDVANDLEESFRCEEVTILKDKQLSNKDSIISNLSQDKNAYHHLLNSAENQLDRERKLRDLGEENIKNLEKQNKKLKTGNFILKYIVPTVAFGTGIYLGRSL